jgi:hypothetical protein
METVTMPKQELNQLKRKAEIADDAIAQLKLSLEDMKHKRISRFKSKVSQISK